MDLANRKNIKLRVAYLIPNIACYLMVVYIGVFLLRNAKELDEIKSLGLWLFMLIMLLMVSLFCSYRIYTWIKQGKM